MSHPPLSLVRAARIVALALPLAALLMMYMAVTAHADVICVPNDAVDGSCTAGQSEATIQAAINAAVTGVDTVRVGPGTYNENLTLGKNIPLLGAQNGVAACGRVASESVITAASGDLLTLVVGSAGARINGFHFSGAARGITSGSGPIDNVEIRNNRFTGYTGAGVFLNDPGIDITVDNNELDGGSKTSGGASFHLDTDGFDGFHFTNNCVRNAPLGPGFFTDGNRNVGLSAGRGPLFDGNLFETHTTNVGVNIGSRAVEDAVFSNNTFRLNGFDGLQGGPIRTTFTANTFDRNGRNGLVMTSFGNQTAGRGSADVTILQNCFVSNGLTPPPPPAPTPPAGAGLRFSAQPQNQSSNIFNNNDFIGNLPGAINTDTDPIDGTNNYWGAADGPSGVGPGSGDIVSGPPTPGTGVITFAPFSTIPQSFAGSLCNPFTPTPTATATPTATPTNTPTNPPATQRPTPTQVLVGGVTVGTFAPAVVAAVTSGASGSLAPTVLGGLGLLVAAAFVVGVRRRRDR
ncbi:MAG: right-handed parallel beta-helix repeat-containing protein [Ardenticatenales bacterium]|nr:right-handed parallel beta-helix repeat-containing protein [Ardenticatenales bacterium]